MRPIDADELKYEIKDIVLLFGNDKRLAEVLEYVCAVIDRQTTLAINLQYESAEPVDFDDFAKQMRRRYRP